MDYTRQSLGLKLRKAMRYVRLYGPGWTRAKIRGQYHKNRRYDTLPGVPEPPATGGHVGIIGCGNFSHSNIAYFLTKNYGRILRGAMDRNDYRAASLYEDYGLRYYTTDAKRLIDDPEIDLIFIVSNHASHAEYAVSALAAGKSVHIEKPHVVNRTQLVQLCRAMTHGRGKVALGFNRPFSRYSDALREELARESGPAMFNWFVVGHQIGDDHWYMNDGEGGRVLGNLCHWTDYLYQMVPAERRYPITINPTRWERADSDIVVTFVFGDGSIGSITFSSKGYTFEGVRESLFVNRGDLILSMSDFHRMRIERREQVRTMRTLFRDQGHLRRMQTSYELVRPAGKPAPGASVEYVWETGELFLKAQEALENDRSVTVEAFDPSCLEIHASTK